MSDRSSDDFVSEAQEVIESFSRNLLELDRQQRAGDVFDPDLVNAAFRAVHSLKGLAALFGAEGVTSLSHTLESTLDALRLGKLDLDRRALDVLFEGVEAFQRQLGAITEGEADFEVDVSSLVARIEALANGDDAAAGGSDLDGVDESVLGVLTEYEEHRLRENVKQGRNLYRIHASFDLMQIDVGIEALKAKAKGFGEVITYLPSADSSADDRIDLDVLMGSDLSLGQLREVLAAEEVTVDILGPDRVGGPRGPAAPTAAPQVPSEPSGAVPRPDDDAAFVEPLAADDGEAGVEVDEGNDLTLRSLSQTVRVDLHRLDHLMNLVGELGLVQANLGAAVEGLLGSAGYSDQTRELQLQVRGMARKLAMLQQGILDVRMVPLGQVFDKLARVVRKLGRESGKDIRLSISGSETELDKLIVEELSDALMHLIRNCIDHGVEPDEERVAAGKPASGRINLRAYQKGNRVVIEVEDDGRGMDWRKIRDVAVKRGVIDVETAAELGEAEALSLIFTPGFSTKDGVTRISGRGVGMDVVKTNISRLSGMIDVDTAVGRGTSFLITLPVTLAIIQALVIQTAGQTFCIPLNSVLESIMISEREIVTVEGAEVISLRGKTLPLLHLSRLFSLDRAGGYYDSERIYVVIVGLAQHRVGLVVDELLGQQDVVIKALGAALRDVPGIAGATELGANRTVLLLDVATLVREAIRGGEVSAALDGGASLGR